MRKKGKALAKLDARSRHKLRIQTKKLRYAAEFFANLFSNKRVVKRRKRPWHEFHASLPSQGPPSFMHLQQLASWRCPKAWRDGR